MGALRVVLLILVLPGCSTTGLYAAGYDAACYYASFPYIQIGDESDYHNDFPPSQFRAFQDCYGTHPRDRGPDPSEYEAFSEEEVVAEAPVRRLVPYRTDPPESPG